MIDLMRDWLQRTKLHLQDVGAKFAIVGGLAVTVRGRPRFTHDIDFAIAVDGDAMAEQILGYLIRYGYRPVEELDRTDRERLATMRLLPPGGTLEMLENDEIPIVDLLFASCGIENEVVADAKLFSVFPGVRLPVALAPHLIAMKVLSNSPRRPQDLADIQSLILKSDEKMITEARHLVAMIVKRGFNDGRDLSAELDQHLLRFRLP